VTSAVRKYFDAQGFLEIETPILTKSTPEGARDYLVPSRVHPGEFFALPQSPQLFKQILMIAGMDRYVQICKCFRDEDLRADRQPEFTQIDVEMAFARPETIFGVIEPLMKEIFALIGREIVAPFPRMPYADAIAKYGSDKPDLRCGMAIQDFREHFRESTFRVFREIVAGGGTVRGFVVPNAGGYSRSEVDGIVDQAKQLGAAGLIWARRADDGAISSSILKALGEEGVRGMLDVAGAGNGELLLVAAGEPDATSKLLGQLRLSAPPVHVAARRRRGVAPGRAGTRAGQGVRSGPQRERDRRGEHPDPRRRDAEPGLLAPQHQPRRGEAAVRLLSGRAGVWDPAPRRDRARPRSHRRHPLERDIDPGSDCVSEDGGGGRPDVRRPVAG
jgi:aspartyl-tRNA synthetase